ncbi:CsbD family protein [Uliginosibacterium flavum]|uniref:CsbD family protein n=1 Tax=Uliginosibacterium flavum TaxID=1396831 RepID=A0ABV2TJ57_9RHOO
MNWDIVEGDWKQFKGKVKTQWGKLTDDKLDEIAGKRIELSGKLQEAYGISRDEAETQIKRFEKNHKDSSKDCCS